VDLGTTVAAGARGLISGAGYGLLAMAVVLTFRSTGVLNLALGGIASVAAFVLWETWAHGPLPLVVAIIVAVAVAAAMGVAGHVVMRPLERSPVAVKAVVTLGLLLAIQGGIDAVWGPADRFLPLVVRGSVGGGDLRFGRQQLVTAGVAVAVLAALTAWTRRRPLGLATLAVGEDVRAARALGIRPGAVSATVWGISAALAGTAGVLLSGLTVLNGSEMTLALVTALAAALLAGFERLGVAVAAAAGVGALTSAAASLPAVARVDGLVESLGFIAVVVVVFLRPGRLSDALGRA
jgi:branched-subunit amino acid ABC-type transport system permease component